MKDRDVTLRQVQKMLARKEGLDNLYNGICAMLYLCMGYIILAMVYYVVSSWVEKIQKASSEDFMVLEFVVGFLLGISLVIFLACRFLVWVVKRPASRSDGLVSAKDTRNLPWNPYSRF
jgi:hypothetical protein